MNTYFKNQLRGYDVVLATLGGFSEDICRNCIGLSGAQTKVIKGLKKLRMDLEGSLIPEMEKDPQSLIWRVDSLILPLLGIRSASRIGETAKP